ncbi:Hypothetical protein OINT_1000801 [Brucella intermedia LMG 3301]|uniref:Uncharacterized protein n=2 Tax=Brucella intermedia TaxID=94625 RepID=U4VD07_9HYPH|nr:Hypothetical protein OINT_1000801 [Brucella intermedia LMG 3301]ERI12588.1 hypothetical protein O206_11415 [Ochrobactrum sp. EGD-AQ16]ERM00656.1 hypothetical protein Q644_25540 [Brucella intermedia 229E]
MQDTGLLRYIRQETYALDSMNWRDSLHFSILNAARPTCETV